MTENAWRAAPPDQQFALLFKHAVAEAAKWRERTGGKIVGFLGADVPVEIILAAGLLPLRVGVFQPGTASVQRFLEMGDSDVVAQLANTLLDGSYAFLDCLVVGNSPTANITLFHFLREARRLDPSFPAPPMIFHEMHHGGGMPTEAFNLGSCRRLAEQLGKIGSPVSVAALRAAIEQTNGRREEIVRLQSLRRHDPAVVTGTQALALLAHWQLIPQAPLPQITHQARNLPRVMLSGSDVGHFRHYAIIEAAGCSIVADDHDWGADTLATKVDTALDPLVAITARYTHQAPRASRWPTALRIASLTERALQAKVAGVVFWISDEDQASSWDLPAAVEELNRCGIATVNLGPQPAINIDEPSIAARMRRWLYGLTTNNAAMVSQ